VWGVLETNLQSYQHCVEAARGEVENMSDNVQ
jgi:hypothetical protein